LPIASEILREIAESPTDDGAPNFDGVRRKYLHRLHLHTQRDTILYATAWTQTAKESPVTLLSITDEDIHGLMEVNAGLEGDNLDLILHSPGGSVETAEVIVTYLRSRFSHIRIIVPNLAMSAATMIACAADEIVLGKHSFLGPTDPQIFISTALGNRLAPAQAILDQFDKAQRECTDPEKMPAWIPMLSQYGPDLIVICETALDLSRELVTEWLTSYMFKDTANPSATAHHVSNWLSDHTHFKSHARHISRDDLESHGLRIKHLESDGELQDMVLSVFHAAIHTFNGTNAVKLVENHTGRAFVQQYSPLSGPVPSRAEGFNA
jgi:hypothetical protein